MIAAFRSKPLLNTLLKVAGLVIALQWPVLADLNHYHDHDWLTSERMFCSSCLLIGTSSDAEAASECSISAQTESSSTALGSHVGAGVFFQRSVQPPPRDLPF